MRFFLKKKRINLCDLIRANEKLNVNANANVSAIANVEKIKRIANISVYKKIFIILTHEI